MTRPCYRQLEPAAANTCLRPLRSWPTSCLPPPLSFHSSLRECRRRQTMPPASSAPRCARYPPPPLCSPSHHTQVSGVLRLRFVLRRSPRSCRHHYTAPAVAVTIPVVIIDDSKSRPPSPARVTNYIRPRYARRSPLPSVETFIRGRFPVLTYSRIPLGFRDISTFIDIFLYHKYTLHFDYTFKNKTLIIKPVTARPSM
jgi:hypothetical protein